MTRNFSHNYLTAAIRETKEETGLDIAIRSIISVASNFFSETLHTLVVVLLAERVGGTARGGDDIDLVQWFRFDEDLPELAFEGSHIRRDSLVSVMYSAELNSATSSIIRQRTDRHGIVGQKRSHFQLDS